MSDSAIATNRFGFGARPGEMEAAGADPSRWLLEQLDDSYVPHVTDGSSDTRLAVDLLNQFQQARRSKDKEQLEYLRASIRQAHIKQSAYRTRVAISSPASFVERLVHFWSNHFAVSVDKPVVLNLAGPFEQQAIRPNIRGSFFGLLKAATMHPAMVLYLDNARSFGPNSRAGRRGSNGLNENLAREILELHTVGVRGGYSQSDVTNFAKVLTGWTVPLGRAAQRMGLAGKTFAFVDRVHEPGAQVIMGKSYADTGLEQGLQVLKDLSLHPNTALHIATKLVRHFVSDEPDATLVHRLRDVYLDNDGNLDSVYHELVTSSLAWRPQQEKLKAPNEWMISAMRGIGTSVNDRQLVRSGDILGQPNYRPGSPAGYGDVGSAWDGPAQLGARIDWAHAFAGRSLKQKEPVALAKSMLGEYLSKTTIDALNRAESKRQALTLLLMSPEFLRR